jgi:hypothetical protein
VGLVVDAAALRDHGRKRLAKEVNPRVEWVYVVEWVKMSWYMLSGGYELRGHESSRRKRLCEEVPAEPPPRARERKVRK